MAWSQPTTPGFISDLPDDRRLARQVLGRAIAAEPADPRLHYWPASRYVVGFRHAAEVAEARARLATLLAEQPD